MDHVRQVAVQVEAKAAVFACGDVAEAAGGLVGAVEEEGAQFLSTMTHYSTITKDKPGEDGYIWCGGFIPSALPM